MDAIKVNNVRDLLVRKPFYELTPSFQFHKGTIRTVNEFIVGILCTHFNSIKVRLERSRRADSDTRKAISIP